MRNKIFLLGVGCTKGGTTWFHSQLAKHAAVDFGYAKEYHIFDALYLPQSRSFSRKRLSMLSTLIDSGAALDGSINPNLLRTIDFQRNVDNYFDYFDYLHYKYDKVEIVGDITPAYAGLSSAVFNDILHSLELRGFDVKVVFLMRDPVERVWSHSRMLRRNILSKNPKHVFKLSQEEELLEQYSNKQFVFRTKYEDTINNLESVFGENSIFYGFYENLFEKNTIRNIESFLSINDFDPDFDEKVNVSPKKSSGLDTEIVDEIASFYSSTYKFCNDRFGTSKIWRK